LESQPSSRTGENPPYGMIGRIEETSASFEARSAPRSYPTVTSLRCKTLVQCNVVNAALSCCCLLWCTNGPKISKIILFSGRKEQLSRDLTRPSGALFMLTLERRRHFGHEARHVVLDLLVRLEPDIDVENHLVKAGRLDSLEHLDDLRG